MDQEDKNKSPYNRTSEWTGDASGIPKAAEESHVEHDGFYQNDRDTASKNLNDLEKTAADTTSANSQDASEFENNVQGPSIAKIANRPLSPRLDRPHNQSTRDIFNRRTPLKSAGKLRKFAPLGFIGVLLIGGAALILGAQSLLPFSLGEVLKGAFDTIVVSTTARSHVWFKAQMDPDRTVSPATKDTIFGNTKFKITDKQKAALTAQGIEVVEDVKLSNGKTITVLVSDDGSGNKSIITPSDKYNDEINKAKFTNDRLKEIRQNTTGKLTTVDLDTKYSTDSNYHNKHNNAFATWRTSVANLYNKSTSSFLKRWGLTRDLYHSYEAGKQTLADIKQSVQDRVKRTSGTAKQTNISEDNGNTQKTTDTDSISEGTFDGDKNTVKQNISRIAQNYAAKLGSKTNGINLATNGICGVMAFVGAVKLKAAADQAQEFMTIALSYLEAIDKTKQGDGDESPLNELVNTLTEPGDVTDSDGNVVRKGTTAMQAIGIQSAYGADVDSRDDVSMQKFNLSNAYEKSTAGIAANLNTTAEAFATCFVGKVTAAAASASVDAAIAVSCLVEIASVIAAPACLGEVAVNWGIGIAAGLTVVAMIHAAAGPLGDFMYDAFKTSVTDMTGEDLGNAIFSGTSTLMGGIARSNGQSLTAKEAYNKFARVQNDVNAEIARDARANLSPFDPSSQYTFLGSLINKLGTASNSSALASNNIITSVARAATSSLSLLSPTASAEPLIAGAPEGTCPELEAIGAVCNVAGQATTITDADTLELDPAENLDKIQQYLDLSGEQPKIKKDDVANNNYVKYILFCENRDSTFGSYDQNIADTLLSLKNGNSSGVLGTIRDTVKYSAPIAGDLASIFDETFVRENLDYVSGSACVAGSDAYYKRGNQYIARSEEDQQMAVNVGLADSTMADAFLEEWYQDHPLDNSLEGVIARRTGMRKDDVIALLDTLEEAYEIANYDPTGLGPVKSQREDAPALAGAPEEQAVITAAYTTAYLAPDSPKRPSTPGRQDAWTSTLA